MPPLRLSKGAAKRVNFFNDVITNIIINVYVNVFTNIYVNKNVYTNINVNGYIEYIDGIRKPQWSLKNRKSC